jgi:hypothetical protein
VSAPRTKCLKPARADEAVGCCSGAAARFAWCPLW